MMGNVEEWVTSRKGRRYKGALMGGFWSKPWTGCRGTNDAHEEAFVFYETGFRVLRRRRPRSTRRERGPVGLSTTRERSAGEEKRRRSLAAAEP